MHEFAAGVEENMDLQYAFVGWNEFFSVCVKKAGIANIGAFIMLQSNETVQHAADAAGIQWQSIESINMRQYDYIVVFSDDYDGICEILVKQGAHPTQVVSYEFFLRHVYKGLYYNSYNEIKLVDIIHKLSPCCVLDWDLFFASGMRMASASTAYTK